MARKKSIHTRPILRDLKLAAERKTRYLRADALLIEADRNAAISAWFASLPEEPDQPHTTHAPPSEKKP